MVALVVIVIDEGLDLAFEIAWQVIVLQQEAVFYCLMPTFDLALGLRVERNTAHMTHLLTVQPLYWIARDLAGPIIAEQTWLVPYGGLIIARNFRFLSYINEGCT